MSVQYQPDIPPRRIAVFVSPHGFGHAARAAAVMEALAAIEPAIQFDIFTTVPDWFFAQSNTFAFQYHGLQSDIGLVQKTPFEEDLPATLAKLNQFLPFDRSQIAALAEKIRYLNDELIICDIAPMGILVAKAAGVPSVLIENFTWDWIYEKYQEKALNKHILYLQSIFAQADYHIQTQPICQPASVDFTAGPVSRKIKAPANEVRRKLKLPSSCRVVIITAGGVPKSYKFIDRLKNRTDIHFIVPGSAHSENLQTNLLLLPENSPYFHPDLINAADAVIGKAGYSTIAEIYQAGVPFGYCARTLYRESKPLVDFVKKNMNGFEIGESQFQRGDWVDRIDALLSMPRIQRKTPNSAHRVADFIKNLLKK